MLTRKELKSQIVLQGKKQKEIAAALDIHPVNLNQYLNNPSYRIAKEKEDKLHRILGLDN